MLFRIAIIFLFTGTGHLLSIFTLKYVSANVESNLLKDLAQIDSNLQLLISIIALGLQSSAIRNIAISDNWKIEYSNTQTARITLSIILFCFVLFVFHDSNYLIYSIAPLLALSGDYALYARGFSLIGAINAFVRILLPMLSLVVGAIFFSNLLIPIYIGSLFIVYVITNIFISHFLDVKLFFIPQINSIKLYFKSIPLGIITIGFYFFGLGIIIIADMFYDDSDITLFFIILKFYVIFKGILRIIHQSFISDMIKDENCLKIDKLSIILGFIYFGSVMIFPTSFITLFFGKQFVQDALSFQIIGFSALIYSLFLSMATKAMLNKNDFKYLIIMLSSIAVTIISLIILSTIYKNKNGIAISLLLGEITLSFNLALMFLNLKSILKRLTFILKLCVILIIPFFLSIYFGENLINYLVSIIIFSIISLLLEIKNLFVKM